MKISVYVTLVLLLIISTASGAMMYTDEASFQAALDAGYYLEEFNVYNNWNGVSSPQSLGPVNGWEYDVSASTGSLWALAVYSGCLSTQYGDAVLTITFTGSQEVKAVGGNLFGSDWDGNVMSDTIHVELSDGTYDDYDSTAGYFRGFTSSVPITSLSVSVLGATHDENWPGPYPTVDHLYVGTPEPATLGLLILGGLAIFRRRRK